jgi:hypothetical protein
MPAPEAAEPSVVRDALVVAADSYADARLRALRAPAQDAQELARVLGDSEIGDFRVAVSLNEPDHVVRRQISEFFHDRGREDLLVLHISCHGLKDEDGTLYFASSNTAVDHLDATAVPSEFVNRQMTRCRSRRIVLLLDCCFGGAFARGFVHRAGEAVAIKEEFEGQGRVVLTASRAMEYAFEGDQLAGEARPSIFTAAVVKGLETGKADRDGDGRISVDELYDYVYDQVREATPNQTPSKWTFDVHGDLYVAHNPAPAAIEPAELPVELQAAMESPFANVRAGAAEELALLLAGTHAGFAAAARIALEGLAEDDSRRVSEAAARALGWEPEPREVVVERTPEPPPPEPAAPAPAPAPAAARPRPEAPRQPARRRTTNASRLAILAARAARRQDALGLIGAALLVIAYFRPASWDTAWGFATEFNEDIWLTWGPVEAFGAALLAAGAVLARRRGRAGREPVDGLLLAVGLVLVFAAIALAMTPTEARLTGTVGLTALGALAIAASGALGVLTRRASETAPRRRTFALGAAGALLALAPLSVNTAEWSDSALIGGISSDWGVPVYLEVLLAGLLAIAALITLAVAPRLRLHAGGALIGIGVLLPLHLAGVAVHIVYFEGVNTLRWGCVLGAAGGLLLAATGTRVLAAARERAPEAAADLRPV